MPAKRIIPCLDVTAGRFVKGVRFVDLRDAGDPGERAAAYDRAGADEVVFLDITASSDERRILLEVVARTADQVTDGYTAAAILASGAVTGELAAALRRRVEGAIRTADDGAKYLDVADGVVRADGSVPSRVEATALAVLALDPTGGSAPRPAGGAVGVPTPRLAALDPTGGSTLRLAALDPTGGSTPRPAARADGIPPPRRPPLDPTGGSTLRRPPRGPTERSTPRPAPRARLARGWCRPARRCGWSPR